MEWLLSQELKDGQELGKQRVEEEFCRETMAFRQRVRGQAVSRGLDAYIRKETLTTERVGAKSNPAHKGSCFPCSGNSRLGFTLQVGRHEGVAEEWHILTVTL